MNKFYIYILFLIHNTVVFAQTNTNEYLNIQSNYGVSLKENFDLIGYVTITNISDSTINICDLKANFPLSYPKMTEEYKLFQGQSLVVKYINCYVKCRLDSSLNRYQREGKNRYEWIWFKMKIGNSNKVNPLSFKVNIGSSNLFYCSKNELEFFDYSNIKFPENSSIQVKQLYVIGKQVNNLRLSSSIQAGYLKISNLSIDDFLFKEVRVSKNNIKVKPVFEHQLKISKSKALLFYYEVNKVKKRHKKVKVTLIFENRNRDKKKIQYDLLLN